MTIVSCHGRFLPLMHAYINNTTHGLIRLVTHVYKPSDTDAEIKTMETSSRSSATKCGHLKIKVIFPLSFFTEGKVLKSRFTNF